MNSFTPPRADDFKLAYTVREFGKALGISHTSIYELIKQGNLKTVKIAGRRLIPRESALKLLEGAEKAGDRPCGEQGTPSS